MSPLSLALAVLALTAAASAQTRCTSSYCQNGGICIIVSGSPSCACPAGYIGQNCETLEGLGASACATSPCLNGGTCEPLGDQFKCACPDGWIGILCQNSAATPALPPQCPANAEKSDVNSIACKPAEMVFMIEYARGDSYFDVDHEGDFIKRLIDLWQVNDQHIRIGVVTYHDTVSEVIHIDDYPNDPEGLKAAITQMTRRLRPSGTNDLATALEYARTTSFAGSRPGVEKILVPIVHMMPEETEAGIVDAANRVKNDCITIIAMDVTGTRTGGNWGQPTVSPDDVVERAVMEQVVTEPADLHIAEFQDFNQLENSARNFDDSNCP